MVRDEGHAKNNRCAKFDTRSSQLQKTTFNARVDVKVQKSHWSVKCRSRAKGHCAC